MLALALAVLAHAACSGISSKGDGPDEGGSSGSASEGASAGSAGAGITSGRGGSTQGGRSGEGGSAPAGNTQGGNAGAVPGGGASGGGEAGAPNASGGSAGGSDGEGGAADSGGMSGVGTGGEAGVGNVTGYGGNDAGPDCQNGNVPLVWLLVSRSSGMFEETVIGRAEAFYVIRAALVGEEGALRDLDGRANVGLTLFGGVRPDACPMYTVVPPNTDTSEVESTIEAVAAPVQKEESPLPAAYAATLEQVRARDEADKTIVIIANSVPDFCDDAAPQCPRDEVVAGVQQAYADGIRTLLVGVRHPSDTAAEEREAYFQAVANAGAGYAAAPFVDALALDAACSEVQGEYGAATTQASWVSGSADTSEDAFTLEFKARLDALGCPR